MLQFSNDAVKKPVVYVAHPVSGQPLVNCFKTIEWIRHLVTIDPSRIYIAPWLGEVLAFPGKAGETYHRPWEIALADDEEVLSRFDEIILVGGRISVGMQRELDRARKDGKRITDMSKYASPSDLPEDFFLDPNEETA